MILSVIKQSKLAQGLIVGAVLLTGLWFLYDSYQNQKQQLATMKEHVTELQKQNDSIVEANKAITADMQAIKVGIERFNRNIQEIKANSAKMAAQLNGSEFKKLITEDLNKAQSQFNSVFNEYLQGINDDTKNYAK